MMQVTFLGTSAALPTVDRNVSSLMVQREGELLMFDCGEGTQRQMMRYTSGFAVEDIFITHYHSDHILGIPGLLRTLGLQGRTAPLRLHGPRGAQRQIGPLITLGMDRPKFPVEIIELNADQILSRGEYDIVVGEAKHKGECFCYAIVERDRLGRFDPDLARSIGIPEGPMWGKIHKGESITLGDGRVVAPSELVGSPRPGRRVVISGDTGPSGSVTALARGADLLIHEATFGSDEQDRAAETGHSTAAGAAMVARDAGARRLVLTHISARYTREAPELIAEAREVFPATDVARDGMVVEVPFRDAGMPAR